MQTKRKALLHIFAVFTIFFLTDSFCNEIIQMAFSICSSTALLTALYTCLDILNIWILVHLYAKYVLKASLRELYLGRPLPVFRWCTAGIAVPFAADIMYFIFTRGEFGIGTHPPAYLASLLFYDLWGFGLRTAVTEGILFWGLLLCGLEKGFGKRAGLLASAFVYAVSGFPISNGLTGIEAADVGQLLLLFLMGLACLLITVKTGSVWTSVVIHFLYNVLSGSACILHIDTRQDFPAVFTYTFESKNIIFTSLPLPSIAAFMGLTVVALVSMKKKDVNQNEKSKLS